MGTIDATGLVQIAFLAVGVIAAALALGSAMNGWIRWLVVIVLVGSALAAGLSYHSRTTEHLASMQALRRQLPGPKPQKSPVRRQAPLAGAEMPAAAPPPEDPLEHYVTSDECVSCHPGKHASWRASYHRTMTRPATPETVLGRFEGQRLDAKGRHYRLERRGDEYWVEMADPDWEANLILRGVRPDSFSDVATPRRWKRVVMTTGSHHMQTYWVASNRDGRLFNFPWLWLNRDKRWIPREDGFIRPPEGARTFDVWHESCVECHAVGGEKDFDPQTGWHPRSAELGIACEACHGPGEEHVRLNRNPVRRYVMRYAAEPDPTIVNPSRLDAKRSSQVCGSCHGINMWKPEPLKAGVRFQPGDDLRETRVVLRASAHAPDSTDPLERRDWARLQSQLRQAMEHNPTVLEERFWPDGMVRVSGREHNGMIESACFEGGAMSCLSCHSMHASDPDDQLARDRLGDAACLQCHADHAADVSTHTHHAPDSVGSRCQNCHMPHTVYGLLKSIRSHWIDSPSATTTRETGRANACNLCHLDRPLGWSAEHLASWYGQPRPTLSPDEETIAEGIRWTLTGNAHQRAMIAWHMGWPDAENASGAAWKGYFLAHLLDDPYPAVRYVASHSLARLSPTDAPINDFLAGPEERSRARREAMTAWRARQTDDAARPEDRRARILDAEGGLDDATFDRLARARDDRVMDLRE